MGFTLPLLDNLKNDVETLRAAYKQKSSAQNPIRLRLLDHLHVALELISDANNTKSLGENLQKIYMGAYVFCLESIASEYNFLNPERSELYKILLNHTGINANNPINHREKLIYLSRFHRFITSLSEETLAQKLKAHKKINADQFKQQSRQLIKTLFNYSSNQQDANKILQAIPAEETIDEKLQTIVNEYSSTTSANNPERKFLAQAIKALSKITPIDRDQDKRHFLKRSQRVKMGFLLYIMQSIWDEYYFPSVLRSPRGNSALYDLVCEALNINAISDIDVHTQLDCLSAFETWITDGQNVAALEKEFDKVYIDHTIHVLRKKLDAMIEKIAPSIPSQGISNVAITGATLGALVMAAPGYGCGYALGFTISQTDSLVGAKLEVAKFTDSVLVLILGGAGNYLGYYASNMVVDATIERGCAKVVEALSMLVGAAAGGLVGIVIYDLSYKTLCNLCNLYMHLHTKLSPNLAKDCDPQYIECLLNLPEDIFSEAKKNKIRAITRMFDNREGTQSEKGNYVGSYTTPSPNPG